MKVVEFGELMQGISINVPSDLRAYALLFN
jgi:hypothetical protein